MALMQMPEWSPMEQPEVDQQDTATSAQGAVHPATSHREGSHRILSVQGKPKREVKSGKSQGQSGGGDDAISALLGSDGGSNEPSPAEAQVAAEAKCAEDAGA